MENALTALAQAGAIGIMAYLLLMQLKEQSAQHATQIQQLLAQVTAAISGNHAQMSEMAAAISNLTATVTALEGQIARFEIKLSALGAQISEPAPRRKSTSGTDGG